MTFFIAELSDGVGLRPVSADFARRQRWIFVIDKTIQAAYAHNN
jgi:hypothetical protein